MHRRNTAHHTAIGLQGPGDGNNSNTTKMKTLIATTKEREFRRLRKSSVQMEERIRERRNELREAQRHIRSIDPELARMEREQVRKKASCPKIQPQGSGPIINIKA